MESENEMSRGRETQASPPPICTSAVRSDYLVPPSHSSSSRVDSIFLGLIWIILLEQPENASTLLLLALLLPSGAPTACPAKVIPSIVRGRSAGLATLARLGARLSARHKRAGRGIGTARGCNRQRVGDGRLA